MIECCHQVNTIFDCYTHSSDGSSPTILLHNWTKYKSRYTQVCANISLPRIQLQHSMKSRFIFRMEMSRDEIGHHEKYLNWNKPSIKSHDPIKSPSIALCGRCSIRLFFCTPSIVRVFPVHVNFAKLHICVHSTHHLFGYTVCAVCAHTRSNWRTHGRADQHTHSQASCVFSFWQFMVSIQLIVCVRTTYHTYVYFVMFTICVQVNERIRSRKIATTKTTHTIFFSLFYVVYTVPTHSLAYVHDIFCTIDTFFCCVFVHSDWRKEAKNKTNCCRYYEFLFPIGYWFRSVCRVSNVIRKPNKIHWKIIFHVKSNSDCSDQMFFISI